MSWTCDHGIGHEHEPPCCCPPSMKPHPERTDTVTTGRTEYNLTEQVAGEIRAAMARDRIEFQELAKRLQVSPDWVSRRLNGHVDTGIRELARMAEALGLVLVVELRADERKS